MDGFGASLALAAATGCSTSSSVNDAGVDASTEHDADADASDGAFPPPCTTAPSNGLGYPAAALPEGGCANEGARCSMAVDPCCNRAAAGTELVNEYTCTCSAGEWQCANTLPGLGNCFYGEAPNCTDGGQK